MGRMIGTIPNFINGVSQQPASLRLPSQAEKQINAYSTVAKGLTKRPPTETVCKISSSQADEAFCHIINRDVTERYAVIYDTGHSATDPNTLTNTERLMSGWSTYHATKTTTAHSDTDDLLNSVDGVTSFQRIVTDGTAGAGVSLTGFTGLGTGNAKVTFSVWIRKVSGTITNAYISITGARVTGSVTKSWTSLATDVWTKYEVTATLIASPGSNTMTIAVATDNVATFDVLFAQVELADAASLTVPSSTYARTKLKVFNFAGVEQQVWNPYGDAYLTPANTPDDDLLALSVADYTFMVNKSKTVKKTATKSAVQNPTCLISFGTVQPGSTIEVYIDGVQKASQAISDTDPSELETNWAAAQILADLVAAGYNTGNWTCALTEPAGSVICLTNVAGTDFTPTVRDGSNGLGIKVIKDKVQYFEDLPRQGKSGFKVEVAGDPVTGFGNYWVKFETAGIPVWKETIKPNINTTLDGTTMPHALIRNASNTFTLKQITWNTRDVGDEDNNPFPSFVGQQINDIFFHKARLAMCAGEGIQMSEAGEFFNFFRTTVTTLVDGDPIDVATNHTKVSIIRHAVPYQEQLLLFSDQTQFRLTQGDVLSPASVGIEVITEYESSIVARPAAVGNFVFFAVEKSDYAAVREYFVSDTNQQNDGRDITGNIPQYIEAGVRHIKGSSNEDALMVQSDGADDDTLFVYKYFWSGDTKLQSSWSKFQFPDVTKILGYDFIRSTVYFVFKRADGVFLERMEFDPGSLDDSGTGYNLCLDRKIFSNSAGVSSSYNSGTDQTTFTFASITWKSVPKVVGIEGNVDYPPGYYVSIVGNPETYNANTIVVSGDATGEGFMFGLPYDMEYELSTITPKENNAQGGSTPITEGRLQLMWLTLRYARTGYFLVTVKPERRDDNVYEFNGRTLGSLENPLNDLPVDEVGTFRVPLYSRNDRVRVVITSDDPLPVQLISADWIGNLIQKFQRG